jgi:hypothetical protein
MEGKIMKIQKRNILIGVIVLALIAFSKIVVMAGNLEPTAPPTTGTMHTLNDIYNKTNNATTLPSPQDVRIITKATHIPYLYNNGTEVPVQTSIYTVTTGKTFYLMGVNIVFNYPIACSGIPELDLFDGTNTTTILFLLVGNGATGSSNNPMPNSSFNIVSSYPIAALPSGTQLIVNRQNTCDFGLSVWGYEQ